MYEYYKLSKNRLYTSALSNTVLQFTENTIRIVILNYNCIVKLIDKKDMFIRKNE